MQPQKVKFKSVQINMKHVSYMLNFLNGAHHETFPYLPNGGSDYQANTSSSSEDLILRKQHILKIKNMHYTYDCLPLSLYICMINQYGSTSLSCILFHGKIYHHRLHCHRPSVRVCRIPKVG